MGRRRFIAAAGLGSVATLAGCSSHGALPIASPAFDLGGGILYKAPSCSCCDRYRDYLATHGIEVEVHAVDDPASVKADYGVPPPLGSCHTIVTDTYVIEGHVPIEAIRSLAAEQSSFVGIALPGMPVGSPGMGGAKAGRFTVYAFTTDGRVEPFVEV